MEQRLQWLVADLADAVASRSRAPDHEHMRVLLELLADEHGQARRPAPLDPEVLGDEADDELADLASLVGLSSLDASLLVVAAAADLDVRFGALFGFLEGVPVQSRATVALALELCGHGSMSPSARARLGPFAPLRRQGLLRFGDDAAPFVARHLVVPDRVVAHLLGDRSVDPVVAPLRVEVPLAGSATAEELAEGLRSGVRITHVRARPGSVGPSVAVSAFESLGLGHLAVDLRRAPGGMDAGAIAELTMAAVREATLAGTALVVVDPDGVLVGQRAAYSLLETSPVPVVVVDDADWDVAWFDDAVLDVEAPELVRSERLELWRAALGKEPAGDASTWEKVLSMRLSPQQILASARCAHLRSILSGSPPDSATVADVARGQGAVRLRGATVVQRPAARLDDVVVLPRTRVALETVVSWARRRDALLVGSDLAGKGTKGQGIVVLFAGSPGTGKTLAAEALAGELGLALCTVDLSAMIDKYVGETEKNLERLISEAENLNVVLFFDEADALFGSRSAVHDARDRYANQEVSYLLQRIERFQGLAVLATNLKESIDQAFVRRLHHVVVFDDPDPPTRRRLWEAHLRSAPAQSRDDPVDVDWLAETAELTGGGIRNAVMAAAFAAAEAQRPVGMRDLQEAVRAEYAKLGRLVPFSGGPPAGDGAFGRVEGAGGGVKKC
ncbi:MAG: ATP-binding protein [Acidimicrobiales bacterium]